MNFTDKKGRKIETRSGECVRDDNGLCIVELYIDGQFVNDIDIGSNYNPSNVALVELILFEENNIKMVDELSDEFRREIRTIEECIDKLGVISLDDLYRSDLAKLRAARKALTELCEFFKV
jgi:hypothetical protein